MKILNKFIWSKKEPSNKNDIWFDGSTWKIYTEEAWQSFTLPVNAADKVAKMLENASEVYQEKLTAGEGIIIEDNEINLTLKTVNGKSIIGEGNIIIESSTPSGKSSVFVAVKNETTYEEIVAAKEAGMVVICYNGAYAYILSFLTADAAYFYAHYSNIVYELVCNQRGTWVSNTKNNSHKLENLADNNVKITIAGQTAEVATPQYVENAIQQSGGGGTSSIISSTGTNSILQKSDNTTFTNKNTLMYPDDDYQDVNIEVSNYSAAFSNTTRAGAPQAMAQGHRTIADGEVSHAEGHCNVIMSVGEGLDGYASHAEGYSNLIFGNYSHAEGSENYILGNNSHAEGKRTGIDVDGDFAHTEGYKTFVGNYNSTNAPERPADPEEGGSTEPSDPGDIPAVGTYGVAAHAEGNYTIAHGHYSHAEGRQTTAIGEASHTEGNKTVTNGDYSHAEGNKTTTNNPYSHAEGIETSTNAAASHAEGYLTSTFGEYSHAEGQYTRAHQTGSHSEGNNTDAQGPYSHAEGIGTKTNPNVIGQHVEGYYNNVTDSVKVIGCGTSDDDRKNAVEVTQDGRIFVKGVGNYDGTSLEAKDLATVINEGGQGGSSIIPDWNAGKNKAGYIKNRTHYIQEIPISTSISTYIEDFPKYYDDASERYYSKQDVDILYTEDGHDYLLTIPANTLLGYENSTNGVNIEINFGGEIFQFESYSDGGDIFIKVKQPNAGNNFRVVLYIQLNEKFIPNTIARKSDLENSGGGKSKFQLYQENGGRFFTDENVYNIFDALRNECSDYYWDLEITKQLESGNTYTFDDLDLTYWNFIGVIYGGRSASVMINDDDGITLYNPGEPTDEDLYFKSDIAQLYVNLVTKTVEFNTWE